MHSAWQSSEPAVIQLKQLLLDPAVLKEFQYLRAELEESQRELKKVQQELEAVTFTQDSKAGRMLMAKCRTLQVFPPHIFECVFFVLLLISDYNLCSWVGHTLNLDGNK